MAHFSLSPPSQLLVRNKDYFEQGKWGLINPTDHLVFEQLNNSRIVGLHQNYSEFEACVNNTKHEQVFSPSFNVEPNEQSFDGIVIYLPKSKQQLSLILDNASSLLKSEGVIMVVGENKAGIKSVNKLLEKHGNTVNKLDSAKHCGLFAVTVSEPKKSFDLADYGVQKQYCIENITVEVFTLPGVFGHKQLDPGTELLLNQLSSLNIKPNSPHIYDFASGSGVVGCFYSKLFQAKYPKNPSPKISMSDNSALAVYCSEQSAKLNGLEVNVLAANGFAPLTQKADVIVSNPPFHTGIKNDYTITEKFINEGFRQSNQYANIVIVANKFLPYPDILKHSFRACNTIAATKQYKVYQAQKS